MLQPLNYLNLPNWNWRPDINKAANCNLAKIVTEFNLRQLKVKQIPVGGMPPDSPEHNMLCTLQTVTILLSPLTKKFQATSLY